MGGGGAEQRGLDAVDCVDELDGEFDFALIAVKSPLHHVALPPLVERGGIGAFVSLGNGLIQDRMEGIVGEGNLLACIVEWGGSNVGPGRLVRDSLGGYMVGELDGSDSSRAHELAKALEPIGRTRVTGNVRGMIWSKLLINSTFTGMSAISACATAARPRKPAKRCSRCGPRASRSVTRRTSSSCRSTTSSRTTSTRPGSRTTMEHMANVRPSMLQDLDAGRDTEVDVVNGGVAGKGRELGIPTPCNDRVVEIVHAIERGERKSEPRWLHEVA